VLRFRGQKLTWAYVMGLSPEESKRLLDELWAYATRAEFVGRQVWREGISSYGTTGAACTAETPSILARAGFCSDARSSRENDA
jgi:hypothetical protein